MVYIYLIQKEYTMKYQTDTLTSPTLCQLCIIPQCNSPRDCETYEFKAGTNYRNFFRIANIKPHYRHFHLNNVWPWTKRRGMVSISNNIWSWTLERNPVWSFHNRRKEISWEAITPTCKYILYHLTPLRRSRLGSKSLRSDTDPTFRIDMQQNAHIQK